MVEIQSKEIIDKISDELKIQPSLQIPRELLKGIQLVYQVNPSHLIKIKQDILSDASSKTIFTTSNVKNTYVIGTVLSISKDVLSQSIVSRISSVPFGEPSLNLNIIRYEPLTVGSFTNSISHSNPILLEKGSVVGIINSNATASIDTSAIIFFYETDSQ